MKKILPLLAVVASLPVLPAEAQDMAAAERLGKAKVVRYRVEGVHKARVPMVAGSFEARADVTDRVTIEYTWDVKKRQPTGPITVVDAKSEIQNLKADGTNCPPPQLDGEYEHFQTVSNAMLGDLIQIHGTRTYPAGRVSQYPASCSMRPVKGSTEKATLHFGGGADLQFLALPALPPGMPFSVSADRKSFTIKGAENWVWTYTPTFVQ
ncbi:MAG TPA: hypothetical protein VFD95_01820 [Usitatibacter sp.]|nr:hypothetical protein [Usitatibacter sp.]